MYKKNIARKVNLFKGFTIAEILITLFIIGFIGALTVPMIARPRLKPQGVVQPHGTMECYWYGNTLYQFEADNINNPNGRLTSRSDNTAFESELCEFTPQTESFTIQSIGGGGSGAIRTQAYTTPSYQEADPKTYEGEIRIDNNYSNDILSEKTPDWVREGISELISDDSEDFYVDYYLWSPSANGGHGKTINTPFGSRLCKEMCKNKPLEEWPKDCYSSTDYKGGDAGEGGYVKVRRWLHPYDKIEYTTTLEKTKIEFKNDFTKDKATITISAPEDGKDADSSELEHQEQASTSKITQKLNNSKYTKIEESVPDCIVGSKGGTGNNDKDRETAKPGAIGAVMKDNKTSIKYQEERYSVDAVYGKAGGTGILQTKVFNNWPTNTPIYLLPGKAANPSNVYIDNDNSKTIMPAAAAGQSKSLEKKTILLTEQADLPFPNIEETIPDTTSISIADGKDYKSSLAALKEQDNYLPGIGGQGAFPFISSIQAITERDEEHEEIVKTREYKINGKTFKTDKLNGIPENARFCPNGLKEHLINGSQFYCGEVNTRGNGGAIIVTW